MALNNRIRHHIQQHLLRHLSTSLSISSAIFLPPSTLLFFLSKLFTFRFDFKLSTATSIYIYVYKYTYIYISICLSISREGGGRIVLAGALFDNLKAFRLPKARLNFLQTMPRLCEQEREREEREWERGVCSGRGRWQG